MMQSFQELARLYRIVLAGFKYVEFDSMIKVMFLDHSLLISILCKKGSITGGKAEI